MTAWLAQHACTQSIWNIQIGTLGHGAFRPEIPLTSTRTQARYGQTGQRVNGSAGGGEWCTGNAVVGDNSTLGCWLANAGLPSGYHLTATDLQDLGYVECHGVTACSYIRNQLGGEAACSGQGATAGSTARTRPSTPAAPTSGRAPSECLSGACLPQCGCTPTTPPAPAPPPCAPLAAVPQDVRDTVAHLGDRLPPDKAEAVLATRIARLQAWFATVESYRPKVQSSAQSPLVLEGRSAP